MKDRPTILVFLTLAAAVMIGGLSACSSTSSTGKAEEAGFLGDYSGFEPGGEGRAALVYLDEDADFAKYDKVIIDPVQAYVQADSKLEDLDEAEIKELTDYLFSAVHAELSKNYEIVNKPGPDVLRIRVAITEAIGSNVALNTVSTVIPVGLAVSTTKKLTTGSHAFVGKAAVEAEIIDSVSGKRLLAAVDERAGRKNPIEGKWGDVKNAYDFWAEKLRTRLEGLVRASKMETSLKEVRI